jgi:hypothetical protein
MERGVVVSGNDVGLLNGQTTKRDSIASVEGVGLFTKQGFRIRDRVAKCNVNDHPNKAVHISGFRGEDGRIVESNAVSVVDIVFSYGRLVRMF